MVISFQVKNEIASPTATKRRLRSARSVQRPFVRAVRMDANRRRHPGEAGPGVVSDVAAGEACLRPYGLECTLGENGDIWPCRQRESSDANLERRRHRGGYQARERRILRIS